MAVPLRIQSWISVAVMVPLCAAIGALAGLEPRLGLFAALGLAFVLLTFSDLAAGVVVLLVVVFAETTPVLGSAVTFTKLAGLLLAMAWLALLATRPVGTDRILFVAHPVFSYLLLGFLAWVAVSLSWASDPAEGLVQGSRLLLVAALFAIVYTAVATRRDAILVVGAFTVGTAGVAAYGLVRRPTVGEASAERLVSTVLDPNVLASFLVAGVALSIVGLLAARSRPLVRMSAGITGALCLAAFLFTGSRGGLVAGAAALVAAVIFAGRWRAAASTLVAIIVVVAVAFFSLAAPEDVRERVLAASQGEITRTEGRVTLWTVGWRMAEDNPVAGVGMGSFKEESIRYVLEPGFVARTDRVIDRPAGAHNTYLQILTELGIVGLSFYLAILVFSIRAAVLAAWEFGRVGDWRMELLARGLVVAIVGVTVANFFITEVSGKVPWLLFSLGPAIYGLSGRATRKQS